MQQWKAKLIHFTFHASSPYTARLLPEMTTKLSIESLDHAGYTEPQDEPNRPAFVPRVGIEVCKIRDADCGLVIGNLAELLNGRAMADLSMSR